MSGKLLQKERPNSCWNCIWCPQLSGRWSFGLFVRSQLMCVYGELGLHFRCLVKASVQMWRCVATTRLVAFLSLCLCVVCLLITSVSPAKTVEPIKMPLGCWLGSKNGPPTRRGTFGVILGHAQTCRYSQPWQQRGSSDATSGYQYCSNMLLGHFAT